MQEDLPLGLPMLLSLLFFPLFLLLASYILSAFNGKLLSNQQPVTGLTRGSRAHTVQGPGGRQRLVFMAGTPHAIFLTSPNPLRSGGPDHDA